MGFRFIVSILGVFFTIGCENHESKKEKSTSTTMPKPKQQLDRNDALTIAVDELSRCCPGEAEEFVLKVDRLKEERWFFCFSFSPPAPGNQLLITVNDDGSVESMWGY